MIPESIMHGYFKLSVEREVRVDSLCRLISTDAVLISFWANTLQCSVSSDAVEHALSNIESRTLGRIIQSHLLSLQNASVQTPELEWRNQLQLSILAQILFDLRTTASQRSPSHSIQPRILMALAGYELQTDIGLKELYEFRYVDPHQLVDASPQLCAYVCVSQNSPEESAQIAKMLFDVDEQQYADLCEVAEKRCEENIEALSLVQPLPEHWRNSLGRAVRLGLYSETLSRQSTLVELHHAYQRICAGLYRQVPECFVLDAEDQLIRGISFTDIKISAQTSPSMLARCARDREEFSEEDEQQSCVIDRQIMRRLSASRVRIIPLQDNGELIGVILFPDDFTITDQHLAERRDSIAEFAFWMNRQRQEKSRRFMSMEKYRSRHEQKLREIVHEVNNPLSIINNYLHILELKLEGESGAKDQLQLISEEIRRTSTIIRRVVEVPRLQDEDTSVDPMDSYTSFSLNDTIFKVAELSRGYARNTGISIDIDAPGAELFLRSDSDKLTQMLINLSKNAVEAMREEVQGDRLVFEFHDGIYRNGSQGVEIVVRDNGPGISEQVLGSLYEPKKFTRGSGLGLHITFTLLQSLGGAMDVRTSSNGTAFSMFLPTLSP